MGAVAVHAACPEGPTGLWGDGTRRGDTLNMPCIFVTLDVSKLSGWLNADAPCRVMRRAYEAGGMRAGRREGVGRRSGASSVQARAHMGSGGGAGAERTQNIQLMSVTLDVSKLSGWSNADAPCRVRGGGMVRAGQEKGVVCGEERARSVRGGSRGGAFRHAQSAPQTCRSWL